MSGDGKRVVIALDAESASLVAKLGRIKSAAGFVVARRRLFPFMTPPLSVSKDFLLTGIKRPIVSVWGAALLMDRDEKFIEARLDADFQFAWNIALDAAGARRSVRVLTAEALALRAGRKPEQKSLPEVLAAILPQTRKTMRLPEVAFALHCRDWHIANLVKAGLLQGQRGNANNWLISVPSLAQFLTARRMA